MHVPTYVYRSPLCNCVHGRGQDQLGLGEMSLNVTTIEFKLARDTRLAVMLELIAGS